MNSRNTTEKLIALRDIIIYSDGVGCNLEGFVPNQACLSNTFFFLHSHNPKIKIFGHTQMKKN